MLIDRRTLLLGALATAVASCSSGTGQGLASGGTVPLPGVESVGKNGAVANPPRTKVPGSIAMVGDSITALSQTTIDAVLKDVGFATIAINAEPSRRIEVGSKKPMPGLDVVKFIQASNPPDMWVIALGTNDAGLYGSSDDYKTLIEDVLNVIPKKARLVWVTTYRKDQLPGCEQFNLVLRSLLSARGNATVGEWYQQVVQSKGSILTDDGVHPNANGILVFADTVRIGIAKELS